MAVILFEDFEDSTITYTTNFADDLADIASKDYYGRIDAGSGLPFDVVYSNQQGSGFFGAQDTNGTFTPTNIVTLDWTGIDISGMYNLELSALFAEDTAANGDEDWDLDSSVRIEIQIDGGGFQNFFAIESDNAVTDDEAPAVDTNFDGVGDGAAITDAFTQFSGAVGLGSTLDIRLTIENLDAGDEDIAFDNVLLTGDSTANLVVDTLTDENDGDFSAGDLSLREALTLVGAGGTITFDAALDGGSIVLGSTLTIASGSDLTIDGDLDDDGTADITISGDSDGDGNGEVSLLDVESGATATLGGLVLTNGFERPVFGPGAIGVGGIDNAGTLTLIDSTLSNNQGEASYYGEPGIGAIRNTGTLSVIDSTITGNLGVGYFGYSPFDASGSPGGDGVGGILNSGMLTVANTVFDGNTGTGGVGGRGGNGNDGYAGAFGYDGRDAYNGGRGGNGAADILNNGSGTVTLSSAVFTGSDANGGNGGSGGNGGNGVTFTSFGITYNGTGGDGGAGGVGGDAASIINQGTVAGNAVFGPITAAAGSGGSGGSGGTGPGGNGSAGSPGAAGLDDPDTILNLGGGSSTAFERDATALVVDTLVDEDDGDYSDGDLSLREALAIVSDGGTITFDAGLFTADSDPLTNATIGLTEGTLDIDRAVTINGDTNGDGITDVTIDGSGNGTERALTISGSGSASLESLTFQNFDTDGGGGAIDSSGTLRVQNSNFLDNESTTAGGAIRVLDGSSTYIANSSFLGNATSNGGGAVFAIGNLTVLNSTFFNNQTTNSSLNVIGGGAVGASSNAVVTLTNSTITGNYAAGEGGGLSISSNNAETVTIENTIIAGNSAAGSNNDVDGTIASNGANIFGSVATGSAAGDVTLDGTAGNALADVFETVTSVTVGGQTFDAGEVTDNGGPTQTALIQLGGLAEDGGVTADIPTETDLGIDVDGDGTVSMAAVDVDQLGNGRVQRTQVDIGAVENAPRPTLVVDTLVDEDDGDYSAGDLSLREALTLVDDGGTITFDDAITGGTTAGVDDGRIVLNGGLLVLSRDVTIDGNTNGNDDAEITIDANDASRVISVNGASTDVNLLSLNLTGGYADRGGALRAYSGQTVDVIHSTISGNYAAFGGGFYNQGATLNVVNSLVVGNNAVYNVIEFEGGYGGGIYATSSGSTTLINTTVTGNSATGSGSGIYNDAGTVAITNSTIVGNLDDNGGTTNATNSIIAGIIFGTLNSSTNSLLVADAAAAGLGALADNGGSVQTHALITGSLAISQGDAAFLPLDTFDLDGDNNNGELLPNDANGVERVIGTLDIGAVEFAEGDLIGETASTAGTVTVDGLTTGEIDYVGDEDWFAVTLIEGQAYQIDLEGSPTGQGTLSDTFLRGIYDPTETLISGTTNDDDGDGANSRFTFSATTTGTHFISASAFGANTGTYTLLLIEVDDDFGETAGFAGSVGLGNPATGDIEFSGDEDWFAIEFVAGVTYQIDLEGSSTGQGTLGDPFLRGIYDPAETLISGTTNDDDGEGFNSRLTFTATTTGTHFISAGGSGSNVGTYALSVGQEDAVTLLDDTGALVNTFFNIADAVAAASDNFTIQVDGALYSGASETVTTTLEGLTIDLPDDVAPVIILDGFAAINLTATGTGTPELVGNDQDNVLTGGDGDDVLEGGAGGDVHQGGAGLDAASYETALAGVRADLQIIQTNTGDAAGDSYVSVENLIGSDLSDLLAGDAMDNHLSGGDGNDLLFGRLGDDVLEGGVGGDVHQGGAGLDAASYETALAGVRADLQIIQTNTGDAAGDSYVSVENLIGSDLSDLLAGDAMDNHLSGGDGNDLLFGRLGDDVLEGGAGNDVLHGGGGSDTFTFTSNDGDDTVAMFADGFDTIQFVATGLAFNDLIINDNGSGSAEIDYGTGTIKVNGSTAALFDTTDFEFV